jgi:hypothetical protein
MSGQAMEERMFSRSYPYGPSASSFFDSRPERNMSYGMKSPGYPRGSGNGYSPQPPPRPSWNSPSDNIRRNGFEPLQAHSQRMSTPPPPSMNQVYSMQSPSMQQSDYYYPQQTMEPSFFDGIDQRTMFRPQRQPPRPIFQQERFNQYDVPSWFADAVAASSSYWSENDDGRFSPRRGMSRPSPPFYPPPMDTRAGGTRWNPRGYEQPGNPYSWNEQDLFLWDPWRDGFRSQTYPSQPQNWGTYGGNNNDDEYDFISPGENGFGPRSAVRSPSVNRKQRQKPRTKGPMGPSFTEEDDKNIIVDVLPNHPPDAVFSYTVPQSDKAKKKSSSSRDSETRNDGFNGPDPIGSEPKSQERQQTPSSTFGRDTARRRKKSTRSHVDPFGPSFTDTSVSREVVMGPKMKSRTSASKVKPPEERAKEPSIEANCSENVFIAGPSQSDGSNTNAGPAGETISQPPQVSVVQPRGVVAATPDVDIADDNDHRVFIVGGIPLSNGKSAQTPPQNDVVDTAMTVSPLSLEESEDLVQSITDGTESGSGEAQSSPHLSAYEQQLQAFYNTHAPPSSPMQEMSSDSAKMAVENIDSVSDKSDNEQTMQSFYGGGPPRK